MKKIISVLLSAAAMITLVSCGTVEMPDLEGMQLEDAEEQFDFLKIKVEDEVYTDDYEEGEIFDQSVKAGKELKSDSKTRVNVTMCIGGGEIENVKEYYDALSDADAEALVNLVPKDILTDLEEEADMDYDDVVDCVEEVLDDENFWYYYEDEYDDYHAGDDIEVFIVNSKKADKNTADDCLSSFEEMLNLLEDYIDGYELNEFDLSDITEWADVEYKIIDKDSSSMKCSAFKYKDKWFNRELVDFVLIACAFY